MVPVRQPLAGANCRPLTPPTLLTSAQPSTTRHHLLCHVVLHVSLAGHSRCPASSLSHASACPRCTCPFPAPVGVLPPPRKSTWHQPRHSLCPPHPWSPEVPTASVPCPLLCGAALTMSFLTLTTNLIRSPAQTYKICETTSLLAASSVPKGAREQ